MDTKENITLEVDSVRCSTQQGHKHLLTRLQNLIANLEKTQCESIDWKTVAFDLNLFLDAFEQHQEHQEECMSWLFPNATTIEELNQPPSVTHNQDFQFDE